MTSKATLQAPGPLTPYRALDLTNEKGFLCSKILGDLGVDVIKVEPPGGDPSRNVGPFYQPPGQPRQSLYWWAYNTSKRGITLDIRSPRGQEAFKKLVKSADFLVESFPPGYLDSLGLGYSVLNQINPGLIFASITPFGQTGPYRDYKMTDLIAMAMGGQMYVAGDEDRAPLRIGVPQGYLLGGAHAAVGCMLALVHREKAGQGQFIDVSIEESVTHILSAELSFWEYANTIFPRSGPRRPLGHLRGRQVWPCKDGFITFRILGGSFGRQIRYLVEWMDEEGLAGLLKQVQWESVNMLAVSQMQLDFWEEAILSFFARHTKAELYKGATQRHIAIGPVYNFRELLQDIHLASRNFWVKIEHPEIGIHVPYPGAPYIFSETPWRISRRAPLVGEHNKEVQAEMRGLAKPTSTSIPIDHCPVSNCGQTPTSPLAGVLVVDFTRVFIGPLVTKYLGDFGATVVRIESRTSPDIARVTAPYKGGKPHLDRSGVFAVANSSKHSLGLNMKDTRGVDIARRLITKADVVVENFSPGVMERWGLGYEDIKRFNPDIIMFRHSIMGQTGPLSQHPGFGWNVNGLAGFNHVIGWPDREAVGPNVPYPDFVAPWYAVVGILAALDYRRRTGRGQCIDQSQLESGVTFLASALLDFAINGRDRGRRGNRSSAAVPHGAYPCKGQDRWCAIAVQYDEEWQAFCRAVGKPSWTGDPRFSTQAGRRANEDELDKLVAEWTINYSAEEVMSRLQAIGVPAGVVQTNQDIMERDLQLKHREHFVPLEHPELGVAMHPTWPIRLSLTSAQIKRAPCLGEHTEMVCTKMLGMTDEEFAELVAAGVLELRQ